MNQRKVRTLFIPCETGSTTNRECSRLRNPEKFIYLLQEFTLQLKKRVSGEFDPERDLNEPDPCRTFALKIMIPNLEVKTSHTFHPNS